MSEFLKTFLEVFLCRDQIFEIRLRVIWGFKHMERPTLFKHAKKGYNNFLFVKSIKT